MKNAANIAAVSGAMGSNNKERVPSVLAVNGIFLRKDTWKFNAEFEKKMEG